MRILALGVTLAAATTALTAQNFVQISIGVRETVFGGSTVTTIGMNGGSPGGIEWINRDAQTLLLDGTWQTFTFDLANDPILGFAGTTANSILEGTHGTLEHIRVLNAGGITDNIVLHIDDVTDTTATLGSVLFGDFELYAAGAEVMFQEPSFSGSTSGNVNAGGTSGVSNDLSFGTASDEINFQFIDNSPTRWLRLTTFNASNLPNPVVQFDDNSVVTFRLMGYVAGAPDLGLQGPGTATAQFVGTGLNAGESLTFHAGGAPANTIGAIGVSFYGFPDLPIMGGTVASGTGLFLNLPLFADANGHASMVFTGHPAVLDFALQAVFIDMSLPRKIAFTNAFQAQFGQ